MNPKYPLDVSAYGDLCDVFVRSIDAEDACLAYFFYGDLRKTNKIFTRHNTYSRRTSITRAVISHTFVIVFYEDGRLTLCGVIIKIHK